MSGKQKTAAGLVPGDLKEGKTDNADYRQTGPE